MLLPFGKASEFCFSTEQANFVCFFTTRTRDPFDISIAALALTSVRFKSLTRFDLAVLTKQRVPWRPVPCTFNIVFVSLSGLNSPNFLGVKIEVCMAGKATRAYGMSRLGSSTYNVHTPSQTRIS